MNKIFNNEQFNSNDGMITYIWGPALWHSLHTISFNYPTNPTKQDKKNYYDFFIALKNILPCRYCRENYSINLEILPLNSSRLKNRTTFSKWVYELHELVNKNLNKKSDLSYEDVKNRYEHFRSRCLNDPEILKNNKEKGCTEPLFGIKSKCVLNIVPNKSKKESFNIDKKCLIHKSK